MYVDSCWFRSFQRASESIAICAVHAQRRGAFMRPSTPMIEPVGRSVYASAKPCVAPWHLTASAAAAAAQQQWSSRRWPIQEYRLY